MRSRKGDSFVQHRLHLRTWWWKRLQEACEVHAPKIMNLLKKSQPSCLKFLEAKRGEGQQDIIRAEAMTVRLVSRQDL